MDRGAGTKGPLIVLSGPSGVGKTTLVDELLARTNLPVRRAVTATTRRPRPGEEDGIQYHFWTADRFREAIRREQKVRIGYTDEKGAASERVIWPIALAYYEDRRTIAAWCELRAAFRHFRTDRIQDLGATGERYPKRRVVLVAEWRREHKMPGSE